MCGDNISATIYVICVSSNAISVSHNKKQLECKKPIPSSQIPLLKHITSVVVCSIFPEPYLNRIRLEIS